LYRRAYAAPLAFFIVPVSIKERFPVTTSLLSRPDATEYAPAAGNYVALVPEHDILAVLDGQLAELLTLLRGATEEEGNTRHPPYTWSIKEVVGHITDAERVFGYRALCIARNDQTPLPGFEENDYVRAAAFDAYPLRELVAEFEHLRRSHLCFFRNLPGAAWQRRGVANGSPVSVRGLAYIIAGHTRHHGAILHQRLKR
jgi:hypothetical protein